MSVNTFAIWKIGNKELKLKLKVSEIERLERSYGVGNLLNPLMQAENGQLPALTYLLDILHAGLQKLEHGYSRSDVSDIYEDYIDEGGSQTELIQIVTEVFRQSGFFPRNKKTTSEQ